MSKTAPKTVDRRTFVVGGAAVLSSALLAGCTSRDETEPPAAEPAADAGDSAAEGSPVESETPASEPAEDAAAASSSTLLVYFSRAGMNYASSGPVHTDVGNTAVMAGFIQDVIDCDVFEITPVESYPYDYEETTEQGQREQRENARPAIAGELPDLAPYDTILVGSGVWWGDPPMIMHTFFESYDAADTAGKTIVPFTTHAGSGLGSAVSTYRALCPQATVSDNGLAVSGERVQEAREDVQAWATELGLD